MECGDNENRIAMTTLHRESMASNTMFKILHMLSISHMFLYWANAGCSIPERRNENKHKNHFNSLLTNKMTVFMLKALKKLPK